MKTKLLKSASSKTTIAKVAFLFLTVSSNAQQKNLIGVYSSVE